MGAGGIIDPSLPFFALLTLELEGRRSLRLRTQHGHPDLWMPRNSDGARLICPRRGGRARAPVGFRSTPASAHRPIPPPVSGEEGEEHVMLRLAEYSQGELFALRDRVYEARRASKDPEVRGAARVDGSAYQRRAHGPG